MKFDLVQAWKDESYRQSLSEEQLHTLPANPAGELSDVDLASVSGGQVGVGGSFSTAADRRIHSFSVTCDISIFSLNAIILPIVNIADCTTQICANQN